MAKIHIKMKASTPAPNTPAIVEFNAIQFEKKLTGLKDSQDSINATCHWCLENREHHKKIVITWLNVLKRVKVEQRLTLFYLANDVIQYSKRKNYEFVDSWSTALQKATTMVREEKVKNKIIRIFKIWEQRGIYGEEFITDLCGLISVSPTARKGDEPHEFQSQYLIQKIRNCAKLEMDTDAKLKQYKVHNPKLVENNLCSTLKDRAHKDDVEKELEEYIKHMEAYVEALKIEMKTRNHLITLLLQAESQLEHDKKDVKLVATAYKTFASRVKTMKRKVDEMKEKLPSPVPSPDIDAPSPSPDSDLEFNMDNSYSEKSDMYGGSSTIPSAGFYNPVQLSNPEPQINTANSFDNNGFASFMGSSMNFNLQDMFGSSQQATSNNMDNSSSTTSTTESYKPPQRTSNSNPASGIVFSSITIVPPPPPQHDSGQTTPLAPPPMPPFAQSLDGGYGGEGMAYNSGAYGNEQQEYGNEYDNRTLVTDNNQDSGVIYIEDDLDNSGWMQETPTSPPHFERESFCDVPEYHDDQNATGELDVDHRVLSMGVGVVGDKTMSDIGAHKKTDVDHRNLISLTGSPRDNSNPETNWRKSSNDQDYRMPSNLADVASSPTKDSPQSVPSLSVDQDYRLSSIVAGPPPPPPPLPTASKPKDTSTIDMDLSDDDEQLIDEIISGENDNNPPPPIPAAPIAKKGLLPPPPFPPDFGQNDDSDVYNDLPPANSEPMLSQESIWRHRNTATLQWNAAAPPPPPPLPIQASAPPMQQQGGDFYHQRQYNDGYENFDGGYDNNFRGVGGGGENYNDNCGGGDHFNDRGDFFNRGGGGKQRSFRQRGGGNMDRFRGLGQGFRPRGRGRGRGNGGGRGRFHENY